jgi:hypothetical protein
MIFLGCENTLLIFFPFLFLAALLFIGFAAAPALAQTQHQDPPAVKKVGAHAEPDSKAPSVPIPKSIVLLYS